MFQVATESTGNYFDSCNTEIQNWALKWSVHIGKSQGNKLQNQGLPLKPLSWGNVTEANCRVIFKTWSCLKKLIQIHWTIDPVSILGFLQSLLACRNTSCMEQLNHLLQLPLPCKRHLPTGRWLGFDFIIMIHKQKMIKVPQSQGSVALKSYLKKFLHMWALLWKASCDMTDWLGD